MGLCIVIRTSEGLVGLGDSAVSAGSVVSTKSKLAVHALPHGMCFTLTSGLRSITDKVRSYARQSLPESRSTRLFEVANELGRLMCRARDEDENDLRRSRLNFDAHLLLGGRCGRDPSPSAYLIYPQGNWIEVGSVTQFLAIGRSNYAIPLLNGLISADTPLAQAGNAAAKSTVNVCYPIDIAVLANRTEHVVQRRLGEADLAPLLVHWRTSQERALSTAPNLDIGVTNTR